MSDTVGRYVHSPETTVTLDGTYPVPASPKRAKVTGTTRVVFQGGNGILAIDATVEFRGVTYGATVQFYRRSDGTLDTSRPDADDRRARIDSERIYINRVGTFGIDGPAPTIRDAIVDALRHECERVTTPALLATADHASAMRDLDRADREWRDARDAYDAATVARESARDAVDAARDAAESAGVTL